MQPSGSGCGLGLLFLFPRALPLPALLCCLGPNPRYLPVSLLPAPCLGRAAPGHPHHKPLVERVFSVVRKLQVDLQAWGAGGKRLTHTCAHTRAHTPPHARAHTHTRTLQDSASPHLHTALGSRAGLQGRRRLWTQPGCWCWSTALAEVKLVGEMVAHSCPDGSGGLPGLCAPSFLPDTCVPPIRPSPCRAIPKTGLPGLRRLRGTFPAF